MFRERVRAAHPEAVCGGSGAVIPDGAGDGQLPGNAVDAGTGLWLDWF